jgi:hypothetical protein
MNKYKTLFYLALSLVLSFFDSDRDFDYYLAFSFLLLTIEQIWELKGAGGLNFSLFYLLLTFILFLVSYHSTSNFDIFNLYEGDSRATEAFFSLFSFLPIILLFLVLDIVYNKKKGENQAA